MRRATIIISAALVAGCGSSAARVSPGALPKAAASTSTSAAAGSSDSSLAAKPVEGPTSTASTGVVSPIIIGTDPIIEGSPLPPVPTIDLHTGNIVRLDWLLPGDKPVLIWFWAPH
jgi:hypothetical protein